MEGARSGLAEVTLRRTGGVAGIAREVTVPIRTLPPPLRRAVTALINKPPTRALAPASTKAPHPDAFHYQVIAKTPLGTKQLALPVRAHAHAAAAFRALA
jgi:hypothetical protein